MASPHPPATPSAVKRLVVDMDQWQHLSDVARRVVQARLTYLGPAKLRNLEACLRRIEADAVPGDCLEFGVALGGSAILATMLMGNERNFVGYDVFGLIPPPSERDDHRAHERYAVIASGQSEGIGGDPYYGYEPDLLAKVRGNFAAFGLEVDGRRIRLVPGFFADTLPFAGDGPVAFAHIDCDWYDPVMLCLEHSYRRLSPGGFIILDDYNDYGGCRRATDEFVARHADLRPVDVAYNAVFVKARDHSPGD